MRWQLPFWGLLFPCPFKVPPAVHTVPASSGVIPAKAGFHRTSKSHGSPPKARGDDARAFWSDYCAGLYQDFWTPAGNMRVTAQGAPVQRPKARGDYGVGSFRVQRAKARGDDDTMDAMRTGQEHARAKHNGGRV